MPSQLGFSFYNILMVVRSPAERLAFGQYFNRGIGRDVQTRIYTMQLQPIVVITEHVGRTRPDVLFVHMYAFRVCVVSSLLVQRPSFPTVVRSRSSR